MNKSGANLICAMCPKIFYAARWELKEGRKYCSKQCYRKEWVKRIPGWNRGLKRYWDSPTEFKKGQTIGSKNTNWKNGKTKTEEYIRFTPEYKKWRQSVFERDNYTCQSCKIRGYQLNAEHKKPQSLFPELRFDINNGITLCLNCHKKTFSYLNPHMKREEFL